MNNFNVVKMDSGTKKLIALGVVIVSFAFVFPEESLVILNAFEKASKKQDNKPQAIIKPVIAEVPIPQVGIIRRFGRWNVNTAKRFWKWIY